MTVKHYALYNEIRQMLEELYGKGAQFRKGQYEAIEATLTNKRTLIVQKTGWGKSLVYFACTKYLRRHFGGVTFVISPLLALMDNQLEAAQGMGLKCELLNYRTKERHEEILLSLQNNETDLVFVTPETLFSPIVQEHLNKIDIGLFVIDEAHCISDWGHDFRLEYGRLYRIINNLSPTVSVLATTATANDRVVNDLVAQLGENVFVSRGHLTRDSLSIQTITLPSKAERYAWIVDHINGIPGSGIIYCITIRDCEQLARFLNNNGISTLPYHSDLSEDDAIKAEQMLKQNRIKALVSTVKLGMGYDKDDISFVIHFQMPSNVVAYYQQIGRAGRKLDNAYAILLHGQEDSEINDYFIESAFPSSSEVKKITDCLSEGGKRLGQILMNVNIRRNRLKKVLLFLEKDGCLFKEDNVYYLSANQYVYDNEKYEAIKRLRKQEYKQLCDLTETKQCLMKYVVNCLDDPSTDVCGHCANCIGRPIISEQISMDSLNKAQIYLNNLLIPIIPKKRWAQTHYTKATAIEHINQEGICVSVYGDSGYGEMVKDGKYNTGCFSDKLVEKSAEILQNTIAEQNIRHITCVPSLRSDIVKDFTIRLAKRLGIEFVECLIKADAPPQKNMENSSYQCSNAYSSFSLNSEVSTPESIILVDDIIDSGWTLTVCGNLLGSAGCDFVFPFTLASSSNK